MNTHEYPLHFTDFTEFIWDPREECNWPVQTRPCLALRKLSYVCSRAPFVFPSLKTSGSSPCSPPWRVCRLTWDEVLKQSSLSINQITKTDFNLLKFRYSLKSNSYLELCLEFPSWLLTQSSDPFLDDQPVTIGHRGLKIEKLLFSTQTRQFLFTWSWRRAWGDHTTSFWLLICSAAGKDFLASLVGTITTWLIWNNPVFMCEFDEISNMWLLDFEAAYSLSHFRHLAFAFHSLCFSLHSVAVNHLDSPNLTLVIPLIMQPRSGERNTLVEYFQPSTYDGTFKLRKGFPQLFLAALQVSRLARQNLAHRLKVFARALDSPFLTLSPRIEVEHRFGIWKTAR